jgi:hypothetical protein
MNKLLENYDVDTRYPGVSGIEHLQMLQTRSLLAPIEAKLSHKERALLTRADQRLLFHAYEFWIEISRFTNLAEERQRLQPPPEQWWWYLDVLAQLPKTDPLELTTEVTPA